LLDDVGGKTGAERLRDTKDARLQAFSWGHIALVDGKRLDVADTVVGDEALQVTRQLVNIKLGDREQQEPGVLRACSRIP